jgi:RNA polymerase sigma-70 factor (ECF subfamily)
MVINERHLLEKCQKGDSQAYGLIVNIYKEQAYSIALGYVGSIDDAYDLSQDAFIKAYQHIRSFDLSRSFFNWFYQILKRICLNFIRNRKTHFNLNAIELETVLSKDLTPDEQNEQQEIHKLIWKAIGCLSVEAREIIILKEFKEMSYREIASLLDIPEGTVMSRLYHARKALKKEIEEVMI